MKTIKEHLSQNNISCSDATRFDLGYRIARLWDKQKRGEKTYTKEDDFKVRIYPNSFIESKKVSNLILKHLTDDFNKLSNLF